jgi:hypothetical protein
MGGLMRGAGMIVLLRDKTAGRDEKDKGKDQCADDVILKSAAFVGPYENIPNYPPDG